VSSVPTASVTNVYHTRNGRSSTAPTVRNDYFDDQHLEERERAVRRGDGIRCLHPGCKDIKFHDLDYFRNHVEVVH
jgi:hypothetical protein